MLPQNPACQTPGHAGFGHDLVNAAAAPGGAQKFAEAASFRISFSSVRSETALRSRSFSFSGADFVRKGLLHLLQPIVFRASLSTQMIPFERMML